MKKSIVYSILITGSLLIAGPGIGQIQSGDQTPQDERPGQSGAAINPGEGSLGTERRDPGVRQQDTVGGQQSEVFSGTGQTGVQGTDQQQFDQQRQTQQQRPVQQEFGVSPRFEDSDTRSRQQQSQDPMTDRPGGMSDTDREPSATQGPGQGQGPSGGSLQSPGGGGFGGQGGAGGQGGQSGGAGGQ